MSARPPLRRADWRFLLPAPPEGRFRHLLVFGGPSGLSDRLAEIGVAERASADLSATTRADAVVILSGATISPREVAGRLAPDAVLYWEVDRRRALRRVGRRWIDRELRGAGLRRIGMYWVLPDFEHARRYLPLEPTRAVEWFFKTRFTAATPLRRGLELLVRALCRWNDRTLVSLVPCCGVVAAAGSPRRAPLVGLEGAPVEASILSCGASPAVFTSGQDDGSRLVLMPFTNGADTPAAVVKLARLAGFEGHTRREQMTLAKLRAALPPELRGSLPEPCGSGGPAARPVFVESVVPGQMLAASTGRWRAGVHAQLEDLHVATDWLTRFHQATLVETVPWDETQVTRWIDRPFSEYAAAFGRRDSEAHLFEAVRSDAAALYGRPFPIVWAHNDFSPWHCYRAGPDLGVIDWEFGEEDLTARAGPALTDLIYFTHHWMQLACGGRSQSTELVVFRRLYLGQDAKDVRVRAARRVAASYMTALGMHRGFFPMLLVYTWVDRATDRYRRQVALGKNPSDPRADNLFARYVSVLAEGGHGSLHVLGGRS